MLHKTGLPFFFMFFTLLLTFVLFLVQQFLSQQIHLNILIILWSIGTLSIFFLSLLLNRFKWGDRIAKCIVSFSLLIILLQITSQFTHGTIFYSRFGFTVYSLIPIPTFDITIKSNGILWFRSKTHLITMDEIQKIITPDVEVVIVANGWYSVAKIDPKIHKIKKIRAEIINTKKAFQRFNELKRQGIRVAMLAHTTC